ncbi:MAG: adenylosuccinate synthetase, partial [Polyangiaceae bacterium]
PYVTSSNTVASQAATGSGLGPSAIGYVLGICKAYTTRVGSGPFPTEQVNAIGRELGKRGHEFGTVTGRPRRCGWFDAVAARYAVRLNGIDTVVITKLDVLSGLDRIGVVTGYRRGERHEDVGAMAEPGLDIEIEWFEGWNRAITAARRTSDLPPAARRYLEALERLLGVPVEGASVGPEREQYVAAFESAGTPRGT